MRLTIRVFFLFFVLAGVETEAQSPTVKNPIPITPNAASILQYGNTPIGLYTGQANISIPIYEINTGSLKIPINLSYNYNGLKVEDYPTWVGTGWSLNATSVISRQTRGLPDESPQGFNGANQKGLAIRQYLELGITPNTPGVDFEIDYPVYHQLLKGVANGFNDSEPDMFVFSIPGYSGKFYFDESQCNTTIKTAITVPHQNLKVIGHFDYGTSTNTDVGRITKFEITDERGNVFTFAMKERTGEARVEDTDDGAPDLDFENTWLLSSAVDPFENTVTYFYKPLRKIGMPWTVSESLIVPKDLAHGRPNYHQVDTWESVIDHITFRGGMIKFNEQNNERLDWNYDNWADFNPAAHGDDLVKPKALSSIEVWIDGRTVKKYTFQYSYFDGNKRLRLDSFQESNGTEHLPAYTFTYEGGQFPSIGSKTHLFSQDHWGYYTGESQTTLIPPIQHELAGGGMLNIPGNFRTPNPAAAKAGILNSIQYPTGGSTSFEYEPNDYWIIGNTVPAGICGQEFTEKGRARMGVDDWIHGQFTKENTTLVTVNTKTCARVQYQLELGSLLQTGVTVRLVNTATGQDVLSHWGSVGLSQGTEPSWGDNGPGQNDLFILEPGEYQLQAHVTFDGENDNPANPNFALAAITLFTTEVGQGIDPLNQNLLAGGLRVSKTRDCPANRAVGCVTRRFDYSSKDFEGASARSSGSLASSIYYGYQMVYVQVSEGVVHQDYAFTYGSSSQVPVVSTLGNSVGYTYVTTIEGESGSENGVTVTKFTSPYSYPDLSASLNEYSGFDFPHPPLLDYDYRRGFQLKQEFFPSGTNQLPIKSSEVSPQFQLSSTSSALKMGLLFAFRDDMEQVESAVSIPNRFRANLKSYRIVPYKIESSWKRISSETSREVFKPGEEMTTTTTYTHDNPTHMQVTKKEVTNSKNENLVTTYAYRDDISNVSGLTAQEQSDIADCPNSLALIEEKNFKEGGLLSTSRSLYKGPTLAKMQQKIGNGPFVDEAVFTEYDVQGNLLSFSVKTGDVHSYIYGYNKTLPIAHALNAVPKDIYYTSFEETGGTENALARSGESVLTGGSFTFPSTFTPTSTTNTRMSYWYWSNNKWNFSGEKPFASTFTEPGATLIDEVRAYPLGARMITFCYRPGVGMISRTDENNQTQRFEFDGLGRLLWSKDNDGNVLNGYEYYYKNEN